MQDKDSSAEDKVFAKVAWRLLPFMMLLFVLSFLDRVNVGFAALTMNKDLGFTPEIYGFGAGIFFFGYFLFEVPSNLVMARAGARLWIFRIMLTWGLVSMATAFVATPVQFYAVRFLLGVAEAGFFPGMILYLTYWFPAARRAPLLRAVPDRGAARQRDRRPALRHHPRSGAWRARPSGLAMAVPDGRCALLPLRLRHPLAAARRPIESVMARG